MKPLKIYMGLRSGARLEARVNGILVSGRCGATPRSAPVGCEGVCSSLRSAWFARDATWNAGSLRYDRTSSVLRGEAGQKADQDLRWGCLVSLRRNVPRSDPVSQRRCERLIDRAICWMLRAPAPARRSCAFCWGDAAARSIGFLRRSCEGADYAQNMHATHSSVSS
jgi:hypothetical protein